MKTTLKLAAFGAVFALTGCRGWETEERPVHLIKNMDTQEKGKAYRRDSTGLFADGRMMRPPVEGTVAQGQLDEDVLWEEGLGEDGEPSKVFPEVVKAEENIEAQTARGENRYRIYCAPCHGVNLDGKGPVGLPALDGGPRLTVPPPDLHQERIAAEMVVGKVYSAIRNGVNDGNMPSYAAQIPVADRWAIVMYLKQAQLKKGSASGLESQGVAQVVVTEASAEAGAKLYKSKGCNACHSVDGSKIVGPTFQGLWGKQENTSAGPVTVDLAYVTESILDPMAKITEGYPPAMPPQQLSELEIKSIALYIETLK